ncbi:alpha-L-rhamnosidase [Paenibacillus nasutitermitis]|uniref:alpha-L-rhamnosidase n=1 Tax=Paenibacillus nasutitermitis TaxID=1652958 RepID=A0A916ZBE6_9BACL|nr:alpha-L-rhamnosidase [Paenibacillus nasutitermitis]GGD86096.1 alfa-L-rhamnosidase [Paenibacillus nasutitermitis]
MSDIKVIQLRTEYMEQPYGIDSPRPRLSWVIQSSGRGFMQSAYRVLVASSPERLDSGAGDLWDSGKMDSDQSIFVEYDGNTLESGSICCWKVMVWDAQGHPSDWSEPGVWTMGLLARSDWQAKWVGLGYGTDEVGRPATCYRKPFEIGKPLKRAVLYASALGAAELHLNGARLGEDWFAPEWTDYNIRVNYRTYEITHLLHEGGNLLGGIVGDGWYSGHIAWYGQEQYGKTPLLLLQLQLEYADGTTEVLGTDSSWKAARGPILSSDFMMGEQYDARLEHEGWNEPDFDDSNWRSARQFGDYRGWITASASPPIQITEQLEPALQTAMESGALIVDMGQNMVGWAQIRLQGQRDSTVTLRYAEVLNPDGTLYTENLRTAKQTDSYTLKGAAEEVYEPHFTFHGFRYIEITTSPDVKLLGLTGKVIHNAMKQTGRIATSDPGVNQLFSNIMWTQRANFISVPTDCPQRDERMGWTGDAQIFSRTASYNMDVSGFMAKFMMDIVDAQRGTGAFTDTVPFLKGIPDECTFFASAGWADAGVIIPWTMYRVYGDRRIIEEHYGAMAGWIAYMKRMSPKLLREDSQNFGDWLSLNADTPFEVFSTAYFAYSTRLFAEMAAIIGKTEDAAAYAALFGEIKTQFNEAYVSGDGRIKGETQTGYAMALFMDLIPADKRSAAAGHLVRDIEEHGWHITTGIHGIKYLLPVLCDTGHEDAAYRLLLQDTYPSWLYSIRHGATTIWERWDGWTDEKGFQNPGMNSFNHYALGAVGEWLYRYMGGIDLPAEAAGYKHIHIKPVISGRLAKVECEYDSLYGRISSHWSTADGYAHVEVTIPANTRADIYLPDDGKEQIEESGLAVADAAHILDLGMKDGKRVLQAGSGHYRFRIRLKEEASQ